VKTYCKHLVVSDIEKIYSAITEYMHDKYRKNSSIRFYSCYSGKTREYIKEYLKPDNRPLSNEEKSGYRDEMNPCPDEEFWRKVNLKLATDMAENIKNRTVKEHLHQCCYGLPLIRYTKINDPGSGKERILGLETVLFRLYEAVAEKAADPMFNAKIGVYQVASIKGRGQNYGKKAVKRWLATDVEGTKYNVKADVRQCYPSIQHTRLRELLHRDLRKSEELLYLFDTFLDMYEEWPNPENKNPKKGILIGSPVSKDLCNYFLSYAYHYASEKLVKKVQRRGKEKEMRLVRHLIFYMDDIVMYVQSKKDAHIAIKMLMEYFERFLELELKENWIVTKTMYEDKCKKMHGCLLDYMGIRFHSGKVILREYYGKVVKVRKAWTTIRKRIFLAARQKMSKFIKLIKHKTQVSLKFVRGIASQYGWFKNTNMSKYREKHKIDNIMRIARRIVSDYDKGKGYDAKKYYKMWRRLYA